MKIGAADYNKEAELPQLIKYGIEFFPLKHQNNCNIARARVHPAIEFIYVTGGEFEIGIDNETYSAKVGDLFLFRSNTIHTIKPLCDPDAAGEYFVLKINPSLLFQIFTEKDNNECVIPFIHKNPDDVSFFPSESLTEEISEIMWDMIRDYERADRFFYISERAHVARLLISLLRKSISP